MRRGVSAVVVLAALGLAVLTAVAVSSDDRWPTELRKPDSSPDHDPQALVGSWQVMGDPAIDDQEVRMHAGGRVSLREGACVLGGRWSATASGLLIMNVDAATNECRDLDDAFEYFQGVQRYDLMTDSVRLDDLSGDTVAVLSGRTPPADPNEMFVTRDTAPALPAGVQVPSLEVLTAGRWIPVETVGSDRWPDAKRPHAQFAIDGTWHGSDGCNGVAAPWTVDLDTGEWLAGTGFQTEIFCDNVDVSAVVGPARAVGLDGDELVFYSTDGEETGRFVRDDD